MKFDKMITINLGNYESIRVGVSDAPSYAECDRLIIEELRCKGIMVSRDVRRSLGWLER